ncbi:MAG: hypothetical protein M3Q48_03660 [Actinomycetota bacterium]|nr:hypothetical protein [Actinomycetota bacterium]
MRDNRFDFDRAVPAGRVVFQVRNAGSVAHRLALLPLDERLPPLDEQLRGETREVVTPFAGIPARRPGAVGTFAVDLVAGRRYGIICSLSDPSGRSYAVGGMNAEFRPEARNPG